MPTIVIKDKIGNSFESLEEQFIDSFSYIAIREDFSSAKAIFIKPNLTYPTFKAGVTTRFVFIDTLVSALRKINDSTKIYIGEGEGGYNSFSMTKAMKDMGFFELENKYLNVQVVNLSELPSLKVELQANGKPYYVDLPDLFFSEVDFSITCPVPKVHCMTQVSLSMKNQWGCLPDIMRLKNHYVFDEIICQVNYALKFKYAFLDGRYGLDDNGPMVGSSVELNWFLASNSLGAFDITVSKMMGQNWKKVKHLNLAYKQGFIPEQHEIKIIGDPENINKQFVLRRTFWNYPALVAFRSSLLSYIFYFSPISKLLHDIMYTFRKKPVE